MAVSVEHHNPYVIPDRKKMIFVAS